MNMNINLKYYSTEMLIDEVKRTKNSDSTIRKEIAKACVREIRDRLDWNTKEADLLNRMLVYELTRINNPELLKYYY